MIEMARGIVWFNGSFRCISATLHIDNIIYTRAPSCGQHDHGSFGGIYNFACFSSSSVLRW